MDPKTGVKFFCAMYCLVFVAAMWVVTDGVMNMAALASAPIVASAAAIVFAMLYFALFYGEQHEESAVKAPAHKPSFARESSRAA